MSGSPTGEILLYSDNMGAFLFGNDGDLLDEFLLFLSVINDGAACEGNLLDDELKKFFKAFRQTPCVREVK